MLISLHKRATTTPAIRDYIRNSKLPINYLARELGIQRNTVKKWRDRPDNLDRSQRPHKLSTTLSPFHESIIVELRKSFWLSLDDLTSLAKQYLNPKASRSAIDRLLRRYNVSRLDQVIPTEIKTNRSKKSFKTYSPGFVHIDIKYLPKMPDEEKHGYLYVAIDRCSRWVYIAIYPNQSNDSSADFLNKLQANAPFIIHKILTDNGSQFTDRFTAKDKNPTGRHIFDRVCQKYNIEHRLIPPRHPQTNGMVERFNGRIADILNRYRFTSREHLSDSLHHYVSIYNNNIPQRSLKDRPPNICLKEWQEKHPEIFNDNAHYLTGLDRNLLMRT